MREIDILNAIKAAERRPQVGVNSWLLLAGSLIAFAALGVFHWSIEFAILLVVVIFVHELGHLLAMRMYRYKNLKMLFIPLIGGAAMGESKDQDAYKIAMISLFGPLIGFLSGLLAVAAWYFFRLEVLLSYARLALFINAFNLLPIVPLDGGHFLNEAIFARYPKAELGFRIVAIIGLGLLAYKLESVLFAAIAFFMLFTLQLNYRLADAARKLRQEEGMNGVDLTEEKVTRIREELVLVHPNFGKGDNLKSLPRMVANMWSRINKVFPSMGCTIGLVLIYLVVAFGLSTLSWAVIARANIAYRNDVHRAKTTGGKWVPVAELDQPPQAVLRSLPIYPPVALRHGLGGAATLQFIVDSRGFVQAAKVQSSTDPEFAAAAEAAVLTWCFNPMTRSGQPVSVSLVETLLFSPKSGGTITLTDDFGLAQ